MHVGDAKRRAVVRLTDGRTGRLVYVPPRGDTARSPRVVLDGAARSVPVLADDIEEMEP